MTEQTHHPRSRPVPGTAALPDVPSWALASVGATARRTLASGCTLRVGDGAAIASTIVRAAASLDADALRVAVADAYGRLFAALDSTPAAAVVRVWNFVPGILAPLGDVGCDRYMSFNAGRHDAMARRYGDQLQRLVPAASAVGHDGTDLTIHALALPRPGVAIENPRQTPAYRYSARFGPLPPCFARATLAELPGGTRLLVSGTAAIRGEMTWHADDFAGQLALTLDNLRGVVASAGTMAADPLDRFESLRAYHPPTADLRAVRRSMTSLRVELVPVADLCRPDLLIEIEGVANVDAAAMTKGFDA